MASSADPKCNIILAMFGTSVESGLAGLLNIRDRFSARFPLTQVHLAFSSKIIRQIWHRRTEERESRETHQKVPQDILEVKSPAEVVGLCAKNGVDSLVIQSVQIAAAVHEPTIDDYVDGADSSILEKFRTIGIGRPAFGTFGCKYPYAEDVISVAQTLSSDISLARREQAALLYIGHGNRFPDTGRIYDELAMEMRRQYPDVPTFMGMVEGGRSGAEIVEEMTSCNVAKVILKPFMITAGDHVKKDIIGEGKLSLKTLLEEKGIIIQPVIKGLGEISAFADIFVQHAIDAAGDAGIELK